MKQLGGWWRLWIITTLGFTSISILLAVEQADYSEPLSKLGMKNPWLCVPLTAEQIETEGSKYEAQAYRQASEGEVVMVEERLVEVRPGNPMYRSPAQRGIVKPSVRYEVRCTSWVGIAKNILNVLIVSILIALTGLSLRWVFRGFRNNES